MKINKIIILFILFIVVTNIVILPKTYAFSNIFSDGDSFISAGNEEENPIDENALKDANSAIYKVLLGIGIAVAVIIGAVLGIQFIFQSAEGKAKISEALVPYIVGCFVVFGAFGIWKYAIEAGNSIMPQNNTYSSTDSLKNVSIDGYDIIAGEAQFIEPSFTYSGLNPQVTYTVLSGGEYVKLSQDSNSSGVTVRGEKAGTATIQAEFKDGKSGETLETKQFTVKIYDKQIAICPKCGASIELTTSKLKEIYESTEVTLSCGDTCKADEIIIQTK